MKTINLIALLFLVVLTTSDILSVFCSLSDSSIELVVCENTNEEEQREEKENETKETFDDVEEYTVDLLIEPMSIESKDIHYSFYKTVFMGLVTDITSPPPKRG